MDILFENMQVWKLHTLTDYINLALFLVFFVSSVLFLTNWFSKRRNDEAAIDRVCKKLRRMSPSQNIILPHVKLKIGSESLELNGLLICADVVYIMKCYGWGTIIKGSLKEREWLFAHGERCRKQPKPLLQLKQQASVLSDYLSKNQCKAKVAPLIVFADNFSRPIYDLDPGAKPFATSYQDLKAWAKRNFALVNNDECVAKTANIIKAAAIE